MEKFKAFVGIDPGKKGGITVINENGQMKAWKMPTTGTDVDIAELFNIFNRLKEKYRITVIIEEVHSIFGTSASSNFTFGFVCGAIQAIVIANSLKFVKIQPKTWQQAVWLVSEIEYKPLEAGKKTRKVDTKLTSLKAARRLFPTFDFRATERSKNPHDGIIDSALLAEFGRIKNL